MGNTRLVVYFSLQNLLFSNLWFLSLLQANGLCLVSLLVFGSDKNEFKISLLISKHVTAHSPVALPRSVVVH